MGFFRELVRAREIELAQIKRWRIQEKTKK